uniref:Innexin n=1 Tax=Macrostomum lignano TaxID=282301 RepID=A0A1I8FPT9_9PLAT
LALNQRVFFVHRGPVNSALPPASHGVQALVARLSQTAQTIAVVETVDGKSVRSKQRQLQMTSNGCSILISQEFAESHPNRIEPPIAVRFLCFQRFLRFDEWSHDGVPKQQALCSLTAPQKQARKRSGMDFALFETVRNFYHLSADSKLDDDYVDRLNRYWTALILVLSAIVLSTKQIVGEPMKCWTPQEFKDPWIQYAEDYCWVKNTYFVPKNQELAADPNIRRTQEIIYYQWIPYMLAVQAFLYYLPAMVWRLFNWKSAKNNGMDGISYQLSTNFRIRSQSERREVFYNKSYLTCLYLFTKLMYSINAIGQFFLLSSFFGRSVDSLFLVARDLALGVEWHQTGHFPRLLSLQCVLAINIFTEKVFVFLGFWMLLVALLRDLLEKRLGTDGLLVLQLVAANSDDRVAKQLLSRLLADFAEDGGPADGGSGDGSGSGGEGAAMIMRPVAEEKPLLLAVEGGQRDAEGLQSAERLRHLPLSAPATFPLSSSATFPLSAPATFRSQLRTFRALSSCHLPALSSRPPSRSQLPPPSASFSLPHLPAHSSATFTALSSPHHFPLSALRHLPALSSRHLPALSSRHLPALSSRHLPALSSRAPFPLSAPATFRSQLRRLPTKVSLSFHTGVLFCSSSKLVMSPRLCRSQQQGVAAAAASRPHLNPSLVRGPRRVPADAALQSYALRRRLHSELLRVGGRVGHQRQLTRGGRLLLLLLLSNQSPKCLTVLAALSPAWLMLGLTGVSSRSLAASRMSPSSVSSSSGLRLRRRRCSPRRRDEVAETVGALRHLSPSGRRRLPRSRPLSLSLTEASS